MQKIASHLNSDRSFAEITSANGTVYIAEAAITSAFFAFVEVLMRLFEKHSKKPLNYENFFNFFEKFRTKQDNKLANDEDFDAITAAFPNLPEKMAENEISRILDKNLVELCSKLHISTKDDSGRKLKHEVLVTKVVSYQESPYLQQCNTRTVLKGIETNEEREKRELQTFKMENLQALASRLNVVRLGTKVELWKRLKIALFAETLNISKSDTKTLQIYAFVKNFASNCVFYMKAIRTNNFNLRFAVLKNSLKMFHAAKADYFNLILKHLFDFHHFFPPAFKLLMKEAWVVQAKTRKTFKALDENLENLNLELKNCIRKTQVSVIKQSSGMLSVQNEMSGIFKSFYGDHSMSFGKSKNIKRDNIAVLYERAHDTEMSMMNFGSVSQLAGSMTDEEKKDEIQSIVDDLDEQWVLRGK